MSEYQYYEFLAVDRPLDAKALAEHVILHLTYSVDDGGEWDDDYDDAYEDDGGGRLASIIPARADLARGDLRLLYLAWLHAVTCGHVDPDDVEPPVPPGLANLPGPLQSLAAFLHVDDDLLAVAAQDSPNLEAESPTEAELGARIADLPETDKDALLLRIVQGDVYVGAELRRLAPAPAVPDHGYGRRTVAQLQSDADHHRAERERLAAERRERERAARDRAAALARTRHLDALARDSESAWQRVDALIRATKPKEYDQAVTLLIDLRDLDQREGRQAEYERRVQRIQDTYPNRPALLQRLDRAGLTARPAD